MNVISNSNMNHALTIKSRGDPTKQFPPVAAAYDRRPRNVAARHIITLDNFRYFVNF
jgi:hypothetical protein